LRPIASSLVLLIALLFACAHKPPVPAPIDQFPSPLIESTRAHGRVAERPLTGRTITIEAGLPKPVSLYIPQSSEATADVDLVIHFHGSSFLPFQAVETLSRPTIAVAVVLGSGSARYEQPFRPPEVFPHLIEMVESASGKHVKRIYLTSFSAGYGAVRAVLRNEPDRIDGILLLDSLHTGYLPDRKPLASGGAIEKEKLEGFVHFAERARNGEKRMIITHSEVFPGTYASTTETADSLLESLGLKPTPVLQWGPNGMQQTSEVRAGRLLVMGFAGNTGLDHGDHLHALPALLPLLGE
jgi:hypothetical protein